jgi:hypothetical protein
MHVGQGWFPSFHSVEMNCVRVKSNGKKQGQLPLFFAPNTRYALSFQPKGGISNFTAFTFATGQEF